MLNRPAVSATIGSETAIFPSGPAVVRTAPNGPPDTLTCAPGVNPSASTATDGCCPAAAWGGVTATRSTVKVRLTRNWLVPPVAEMVYTPAGAAALVCAVRLGTAPLSDVSTNTGAKSGAPPGTGGSAAIVTASFLKKPAPEKVSGTLSPTA